MTQTVESTGAITYHCDQPIDVRRGRPGLLIPAEYLGKCGEPAVYEVHDTGLSTEMLKARLSAPFGTIRSEVTKFNQFCASCCSPDGEWPRIVVYPIRQAGHPLA